MLRKVKAVQGIDAGKWDLRRCHRIPEHEKKFSREKGRFRPLETAGFSWLLIVRRGGRGSGKNERLQGGRR